MCKSGELHRIKRAGLIALFVSQFGYFPWKCNYCDTELRLKNRGEKKKKRRSAKSPKTYTSPIASEPELDSYS
jgi:hypothetical protein